MATLRLSSFTYELLASVKSKPLFDIWRHISDFRDAGHKLGWDIGDPGLSPGTRAQARTRMVVSSAVYSPHLRREIVVFVSEGSVTEARKDAFGMYLVSCVTQLRTW